MTGGELVYEWLIERFGGDCVGYFCRTESSSVWDYQIMFRVHLVLVSGVRVLVSGRLYDSEFDLGDPECFSKLELKLVNEV